MTSLVAPPTSDVVQPRRPLVAAALASLTEAEVRWCLLRAESADPTEDLDLLVHPGDRRRAATALTAVGMRPSVRRGLGSHRAWFGRDAATRTWVKLDLVTEVGFGPRRAWTPLAAADVLARVSRHGDTRHPDPGDAFWLVVAHALLDRGAMAPRHLREARAHAPRARTDHPIAIALDRARPADADAAAIVSAVQAGDVDRLAEVGRASWPALLWTMSPGERRRLRRRETVHALGRRTARLPVLCPRGMTVALMAPDGGGKTTLAAALVDTWPMPVHSEYVGLYPRGVDDRAGRARPLRRVVRVASALRRTRQARRRGHLVVLDRHPLDVAVDPTRSAKARLRRIVFGRMVAPPDLLVVLDALSETLHRRKPEHTRRELEERRRRYAGLARAHDGAVVDTTGSVRAALDDVVDAIWHGWVQRPGGRVP